MKKKEKIYLVKYSRGEYDDYEETVLFVTEDEDIAKNYVNKFNSMMKKWKLYYRRYEDNTSGSNRWIAKEYMKYFYRCITLKEINKCEYEEVEVR